MEFELEVSFSTSDGHETKMPTFCSRTIDTVSLTVLMMVGSELYTGLIPPFAHGNRRQVREKFQGSSLSAFVSKSDSSRDHWCRFSSHIVRNFLASDLLMKIL